MAPERGHLLFIHSLIMNYLRTEFYEDVAGNFVKVEWQLAKKYEITPRPAPGWKALGYTTGSAAIHWYCDPKEDDRIELHWDDTPNLEAFDRLTSAINLNTPGNYQQVTFIAERGAAMVNPILVSAVSKVLSGASGFCWLVCTEEFYELKLVRCANGQVWLRNDWWPCRLNYLACSRDPYHYLEVARRFAGWFNEKRFPTKP